MTSCLCRDVKLIDITLLCCKADSILRSMISYHQVAPETTQRRKCTLAPGVREGSFRIQDGLNECIVREKCGLVLRKNLFDNMVYALINKKELK